MNSVSSASETSVLVAEREVYVFDEGTTPGGILHELSGRIPTNEFGLPLFYLRSDLLPQGTHLDAEAVDAASVGLFYSEGYPTTPTGAAFWSQLPHEPHKLFEIFSDYLDQAALIGVRQLDILAAQHNVTIQEIVEFSRCYYWSVRSRSYDMFVVAAERKKREFRLRKMEDNHFTSADNLFNKLMDRFKGDNEDWIDELNAKEAVEVMSALVKIQRESVGLVGANASSTPKDAVDGMSTDAMMRQIAQRATQAAQGTAGFADQLQQLLVGQDGAELQAMVLRLTAPSNRNTFSDDAA